MLRNSAFFIVCILCALSLTGQEIDLISDGPTCYGKNDGSITVNVIQEEGLRTVRLLKDTQLLKEIESNAEARYLFTGLNAGTYKVELNYRSGTTEESVLLEEPAKLEGNVIELVKLPSSDNACDGKLKVAPSGGTLPYSYLWNNGTISSDILQNACASKIHRCKINDAGNCGPIEIAYPLYLSLIEKLTREKQ